VTSDVTRANGTPATVPAGAVGDVAAGIGEPCVVTVERAGAGVPAPAQALIAIVAAQTTTPLAPQRRADLPGLRQHMTAMPELTLRRAVITMEALANAHRQVALRTRLWPRGAVCARCFQVWNI
jgi:hypothetical protein